MSYQFDSRLGEQLYRLLPEVYRTRDSFDPDSGGDRGQDLARYLDAHGELLDLIHATLQQQLKDTLPASSQDWLLPYFAQLLAVNIVSPDAQGKHAEVDQAISWRQRKGTLKVAEQIAEAVGQMEAELQEGWKRVVMTARIGMPLMPVSVVDDTLVIDDRFSSRATQHPSLPVATVDLRRPSRAVEALATNPAAKLSEFAGLKLHWRQLNRHGAPCFPGSFDDVSSRTVDMRSASANHGHYHHKRLLAYVAPPDGLIPFADISISWAQRSETLYEHLIQETLENGVNVIRNQSKRIVIITDDVSLDAKPYKIEGVNFSGELKLASGGQLELARVEAGRVDVATPISEEASVQATDCLIGELSVAGLAQLENCTVRDTAFVTAIIAKNCVLSDLAGVEISGVLENSCYPADAPLSASQMTIEDSTTDSPVFFSNQTSLSARSVLTPNTPASIYRGSSESAEMGYYHHGRMGRAVRISGNFVAADALHLPNDGGYALQDLIFDGDVLIASGHIKLIRCAFSNLGVEAGLSTDAKGQEIPALNAVDCIFENITLANGLARLEYCTLMQTANCLRLQASDCIFVGNITDADGGEPESGCIRYSRIPAAMEGTSLNIFNGNASTNTTQMPVFIRYDYCSESAFERRVASFGEAGHAVLDRATPDAIRFGAEDGAEMGAHHHQYYSLKIDAVLEKVQEFLPVGIEPVLIQDRRLLNLPPELKNTSDEETT